MKLTSLYLLVLLFSTEIFPQEGLKLNQEQWIEDIDFLVEKAQNTVPEFNSRINTNIFSKRLEELKQNLDSKSFEDIVFGIQHLLNTIEDEGCNIIPFQRELNTKVIPIKNFWFEDGLFVCDVSSKYNTIIEEKIIKINGFEVNEVYSKLANYLNADNKHYKKHLFQVYSMMPSLLMAAGIGYSNTEIQLQFFSGKEITLTAESVTEYVKLKRQLPNDEFFSFTKTDHTDENYWLEYFPNTKTLFIQLQKIENNDVGASFSAFINAIEKEINKGKANKIILDLRYGGGGNGFKLKAFTDLLRDSETINKKGNLFMLTSNATRGTLLEFVSILSLNTKAIIVGEPTGEGPNTVGDTKYIKLPNSGLSISLTHTFWDTSWDKDNRKTINPDVLVTYNFNQHSKRNDPWIDAALNFKNELNPKKTIENETINKLLGTYKIDGKKVSIKKENGKLFLSMNRKMKSFFEIKTELYFRKEGLLTTDIKNVFLKYNKDFKPTTLNWKEAQIPFKN